ncbi:MEDS domain-containing protein [Saccharothrix sp. S26]|uniref:MEDS domain-containing protein n=1 Tax=Saccharothrix sp. S26 TaxID=2907215 RepID=UPI001F3C2B13|nr:MEDS domain-containing protein [Saccharothrix sp. S26]MCE6995535.1 MEDS domain-containing protein [Saccharothrix sp. S26]
MQSPASLDSTPDRSHSCHGYQRQVEFEAEAREFLTRGLVEGQRVLYVAPGDSGDFTRRLGMDGVFEEGARRGAVQVASLDETYSSGAVVDPEQQVRAYAAATEQALAAGFTGLRVAADATPLVRTPAQLDAFARYEHLVDRYMAAHPMSAMCAYDRTELGDGAVAQLACLHPRSSTGATPFHLHAHAPDWASAALDGELDLESRPLWSVALERADLPVADGEIVIDATGLAFVDHRGLLALADHAERRGVTVVLRTPLPHLSHVLQLLDVTGIRVEQVR